MTSIQIIFHEKLKAIQCFCGFIGRNHQCGKAVNGKVTFRNCLEEYCSKCKIKLRETNIMKKDDGYLVCGTCYEKISDDICTSCFCRIC